MIRTTNKVANNCSSDFQGLYTGHARHVEDSLHRVETRVSSVQTLSDQTHDNTIETIERVRAVERSLQEIRTDIPSLVQQGFTQCLEKKLEEVGRGAMLHQFAGKVDDNSMMPGSFPRLKSYNRSTLDTFEHVHLELPTASEPDPHNSMNKVTVRANNSKFVSPNLTIKRNTRQVTSSQKTYTKNIPLPIGFIQMKTVHRVYRDTTDVGGISEREITHVDISFIPFQWLSTQGQVVSIEKHCDVHNRPIWTFTPRIYNRLSDNAMVVQACRNLDVGAVKKLFEYRQASPFDTCSDGSSLMSLTIRTLSLESHDHLWDQALEVIGFLISHGADTTTFIIEFIKGYRFLSIGYWETEFMVPSDKDMPTHNIDKIWRLGLESCQRDPFADQKVLERLWDHSLGGQCNPPIDPASMFHDTFTGFESLVFENPDKVFLDLMEDVNTLGSGSTSSWQRLIDQKYELITYLCSGGSESIKAKVFSSPRSDSASIPPRRDTCFCSKTSSHLLFQLLHRTSIRTCRKARRKALRQHIYRMLIILLESGEDPEATCACNTQWQRTGEFRTVTDVAASEGILAVWRNALEESGFDATGIIDEWRLHGISRLYEMPRAEPRMVLSPLHLARNAFNSTLSSFV